MTHTVSVVYVIPGRYLPVGVLPYDPVYILGNSVSSDYFVPQ